MLITIDSQIVRLVFDAFVILNIHFGDGSQLTVISLRLDDLLQWT